MLKTYTNLLVHCELEITSVCDQKCFGCDRFIDVAPGPNMTIEQVKYFLRESIELKWPWKILHILGGEPTLHPQVREIVQAIMDYRNAHNPQMTVRLISNGYGLLRKHDDWIEKMGVDIHREIKGQKDHLPKWFDNMRLAPCDERDLGEVPPCPLFGTHGCGVGVTRHGLFLCGAGASIARVIGADIGIMHLRDMTYEAALEQAKILCRVCGHWENDKRPMSKVTASGKMTSPYWEKAIEAYQKKPPKLRIYGQGK